ncbi:hypothetical protein M9Y10_000448 [Tritrichomonas musculus]|uniref:Beta-lactamase-related domain-containing protein n=1 Tax=Tritrichomonas musculus TaxID=1915356 RepID=A0ABR2L582_9EUKA
MELKQVLPASVGVNPESLLNVLNVLDKCNCHSVMFIRHDKIIGQGWWKPYDPKYAHVLFSLSKSLLATAACFAVQEGLISFDDRLIKFFPEYFPSPPCENMQKVTLRHLLMMSYGRKVELDPDFYYREDWLEENLHLYLYAEPGTEFSYDNRCAFLVSAILHRVTKQTTLDYLQPRLFDPLGIERPFWEEKNGYNVGRSGLNLKTEDVAKFGLFLIHHGCYNGKQLLKANLVDEMTTFKIGSHYGPAGTNPNYNSGYGYFCWMCPPEGAYRCDGSGGQYLIVMPKQDMIVVITAGHTVSEGETVMSALWSNLVDTLDNSSILADTERVSKYQKFLDERMKSLMIPFIQSSYNISKLSDLGENLKYSDVVYHLCDNRPNILKMSFNFGEKSDVLKMWVLGNKAEPSGKHSNEPVLLTLNVGHDDWIENDTNFEIDHFHPHSTILFSNVACSSKWLSKNEYAVKLVYTITPYADTLKVKFSKYGINGEYTCYPHMKNRGNSFHIMGLPIDD